MNLPEEVVIITPEAIRLRRDKVAKLAQQVADLREQGRHALADSVEGRLNHHTWLLTWELATFMGFDDTEEGDAATA